MVRCCGNGRCLSVALVREAVRIGVAQGSAVDVAPVGHAVLTAVAAVRVAVAGGYVTDVLYGVAITVVIGIALIGDFVAIAVFTGSVRDVAFI